MALLAQCKVDGATIKPAPDLIALSHGDPLMTRIELLRQSIEEHIGLKKFIEVWLLTITPSL